MLYSYIFTDPWQSKKVYKRNKVPTKDIHTDSDSEENIYINQSNITSNNLLEVPQWPCSKVCDKPSKNSSSCSNNYNERGKYIK